WAGRITRCARSRRLCAVGSWCCWPTPFVCWWVPCRPPLPRQPLPPPPPPPPSPCPPLRRRRVGKKSAPAPAAPCVVWAATLRQGRSWLCPWAQLQRSWQRWSRDAPPPELAALLAHVAQSRPLDATPSPT